MPLRRAASSAMENGKWKVENNDPLSTIRHPFFCNRSGYIFLLSVLFVSAIALSVLGSYMLLSITAVQNGITFQESSQTLEYANTCAERGLMNLLLDSNYVGSENFTFDNGGCAILRTGGFGNENRTLCTEGESGSHVRRMEIVIKRLLPSIQIYSWQEVATITACSY